MKEDRIPNKVLNVKQELRFLQLCCQDSSPLGCYAMQTGKYKRCAKSIATQFFLLIVNLLHTSFNILIQQADVHNSQLIFLHNLCQLQQPCTSRKQSIYLPLVPVWILYLWPLLHFFKIIIIIIIITPKPFPKDGTLWGLQRCIILRKQDLGCLVGREEQSKICDCFLCFQTCVCVVICCHAKEGIHQYFCKAKLS